MSRHIGSTTRVFVLRLAARTFECHRGREIKYHRYNQTQCYRNVAEQFVNFMLHFMVIIIVNSFVTRASSFLLVPRQLLAVPDLKLMEILFHHFDPCSSWSSSRSSPGVTSYKHVSCYPLFWKSLYVSQPAQSLCPYYCHY